MVGRDPPICPILPFGFLFHLRYLAHFFKSWETEVKLYNIIDFSKLPILVTYK